MGPSWSETESNGVSRYVLAYRGLPREWREVAWPFLKPPSFSVYALTITPWWCRDVAGGANMDFDYNAGDEIVDMIQKIVATYHMEVLVLVESGAPLVSLIAGIVADYAVG